jgi:hypothetical protein
MNRKLVSGKEALKQPYCNSLLQGILIFYPIKSPTYSVCFWKTTSDDQMRFVSIP